MRQNISEMHRISKDDAKTKLEHSTELQNIEKMSATGIHHLKDVYLLLHCVYVLMHGNIF
jgi:uncharacterized membrane protein